MLEPRLASLRRHLDFLGKSELVPKSVQQKLANSRLIWIVRVQWIRCNRIAVPECRARQSLRVDLMGDSVLRTLEPATGPLGHHVPVTAISR